MIPASVSRWERDKIASLAFNALVNGVAASRLCPGILRRRIFRSFGVIYGRPQLSSGIKMLNHNVAIHDGACVETGAEFRGTARITVSEFAVVHAGVTIDTAVLGTNGLIESPIVVHGSRQSEPLLSGCLPNLKGESE